MFQPIKDFDFIAVSLLCISYDELCAKLCDLLITSGRMTYKWISETGDLNLSNVIENQQTNSGLIKRRIAIWSIANNSNQSVFLCNYSDGCSTIINALDLRENVIRIRVSADGIKNSMNEFEYIESNHVRLIHSYWDSDKWIFYELGALLPFENKEYYKRRIKRKRIDYEIINEYLQANGWFLNDENFWRSNKATYFIENHPNKVNELLPPRP
jgi:hypothetical protein